MSADIHPKKSAVGSWIELYPQIGTDMFSTASIRFTKSPTAVVRLA